MFQADAANLLRPAERFGIWRLTLNASYSYLNRTIKYDFASLAGVSAINTSVTILPILPKNKVIGTATYGTYRQILGIVNFRYEGWLTLQDTTYATTSPLFLPTGKLLRPPTSA